MSDILQVITSAMVAVSTSSLILYRLARVEKRVEQIAEAVGAKAAQTAHESLRDRVTTLESVRNIK